MPISPAVRYIATLADVIDLAIAARDQASKSARFDRQGYDPARDAVQINDNVRFWLAGGSLLALVLSAFLSSVF